MARRFAVLSWLGMAFTLSALAAGAEGEASAHPPIPVHFDLKEAGFVTLVIEDAATGLRVRNLVSETRFEAGANVAWWDGLDDLGRDTSAASHFTYSIPGKLVSPGKYRVRGLVRPELELRYQFSAYNGATIPWQTKDRASEWLANHTPPAAILFVPSGAAPERPGHPSPGGQLLVGSFVSEGGSGLAWLDDEGHKINGRMWIGGVWTGATTLARDEGEHALPNVYAYAGCAWTGDKYNDFRPELRLFALTRKDPKVKGPQDARFGTGEDVALLKPNYALPAGLAVKEHENITPLGGLAVRDGIVVASVTPMDQLVFVDAANHRALATAVLPQPRGLAFDRQGRLLAISGRRVVRVAMPLLPKEPPTTQPVTLAEPQVLVSSGLEDPQQLALDGGGNLYVSDRGDSHQVKVFAADGRFLRAIGVAGKPRVGPYDPNHMNNPYGLTVDGKGRLWVAEQDKTPKRLSVWSTADGKLLQAFYGPPQYGGGGEVDSANPSRFFYADDGGMELKLDWQTRKSWPVSLYYRHELDRFQDAVSGHGPGHPPQTPIHVGGRTYLVDCFNTNPTGGIANATIWLLDGGVAKRVAVVGRANDWAVFNPTASFSVRWTGKVIPPTGGEYTFTAQVDDGVRLWIDGQLLIDHWKLNTGAPIPVGKVTLKAGQAADLKMEYFQRGGSASATLLWETAGQSKKVVPTEQLVPAGREGHGLTAEYFSDSELTHPLLTRVDPKIQFNWGSAGFKLGGATPFQSRLPAGTDLEKQKITFAWSDLNGDGQMEPEEVTCVEGDPIGTTVMADLTAVTAGGLAMKPGGFTAAGAPLYDALKAGVVMPDCQRPTSSGGGQAVVGRDGRVVLTVAPKPFAPQSLGGGVVGKATWSYPSLWPGLHASHSAPMPEFPGELIGTTRLLGNTITPRGSDAGEIFAVNGNKGQVYLFTTDGLFVATLYKDSRTSSWAFPSATPGMLTNDASLHEENFFPAIAQVNDGSVYLTAVNSAIVKVEGLERVRRLADSELEVSAEQLAAAREYFVQAELRRQRESAAGPRNLTVEIGQKPADWSKPHWATIDVRDAQVGNWGKRKVETRAAVRVTGDRLVAAFETDDANLLTNAGGPAPMLFKTGGALDLMIGADPHADPKRRAPAAGDARLLVTRVQGKTVAVLYRPVAPGSRDPAVPFSSPLRTIRFDRVDDVSDQVSLASVAVHDEKAKKDFTRYEMSCPLALLGLNPRPGETIRADLGVLRGNGFHTLQRAYWTNKAAGIVSDEPSEAELTPQLWGTWEFVAAK